MGLKIFKIRSLVILGISLAFLFFGWNAAEQYLTSFESSTGFGALAILYASTVAGSFLGPIIVRKIGTKSSLIFGFFTYILLVFGAVTHIPSLIFFFSALLGIGAGICGIAQIDLLRTLAPENKRGEIVGSINALRTVGGAAGIFLTGLLLRALTANQVYLILGTVMAFGLFILFFLPVEKNTLPQAEEKIAYTIKNIFLC